MANTVSDERRRLRDRLAQLDEERGHIAYALSVLDRIDPDAEHADPPSGSSAPQSRVSRSAQDGATKGRPGGTFERAVRVVNSSGRAWQVEDLIPALRQDGWSAQVDNEINAVRSALSRAVSQGLVSRPKQGLYAPKGWADKQPQSPVGDEWDDGEGEGEEIDVADPSTPNGVGVAEDRGGPLALRSVPAP
jgi:hypothetical protein